MKANEAPEKIYIGIVPSDLVNYKYTTVDINFPDSVEYTLTDAIIEKACSWLQENKDKYLYNTGEKSEYIPTCSGKMIEDFKNYMKGE